MGWLRDTELLLVALVLIAAALLIGLFLRRRLLAQKGPLFECWLGRTQSDKPIRWQTGVARYDDDKLLWFRVFSWMPGPRLVLTRSAVRIEGRRPATDAERRLLPGVITIVTIDAGEPTGQVDLAMTPGSQTGFSSWLEAAPPGQRRLG